MASKESLIYEIEQVAHPNISRALMGDVYNSLNCIPFTVIFCNSILLPLLNINEIKRSHYGD